MAGADPVDCPEDQGPESRRGLSQAEASRRLLANGANRLPEVKPPSLATIWLRQFLSPLVYVLALAAAVSLALGDTSDAIFIAAVLLLNGIVGTAQEYSAGRAAAALRKLEQPFAVVIRDSRRLSVPTTDIVDGDTVVLESGSSVPADLLLLEADDLRCDESLLTGESKPVSKSIGTGAPQRALAGTLVVRGRGSGLVTATGEATELGQIAAQIGRRSAVNPPLVLRMERFSRTVAYAIGTVIVLIVAVGLLRGLGVNELFALSVGLAVSAIPEGLPVAISVALAISMRRMAKVGVIVRRMAAVEALGSCTIIATDKTGTLTLNALTVTDIVMPDGMHLQCEVGTDVDSCRIVSDALDDSEVRRRTGRLLLAASLPNEADLVRELGTWVGRGDTVDVALLGAARKGGLDHAEARLGFRVVDRISYEPDLRYAASLHRTPDGIELFVKGAPETLIEMCDSMDAWGATVPIDRDALLRQRDEMATTGLRVLAFASGTLESAPDGRLGHAHLAGLNFLGLAGMQDPVRPEVPSAIAACRSAGIAIVMITGDDPRTAAAIGRAAGMEFEDDQVVTGDSLRGAMAAGEPAVDLLTTAARIYARVDPSQKLTIVQSLQRGGHFVAMTGDGINDAPALRHAHVGVAMGTGTEVAKESADIVVTDDNFASIVKGIAEGRAAYANIRKVVLMLVSTGAAELVLFLLTMPFGLPLPLTPLQLLWLNLVTNGLQDVALAAEKREGDELAHPPRRPNEPLFDALMIRRVVISAVIMGVGSSAVFAWLVNHGYPLEMARSLLLVLFVAFENFQTLACRSERHSVVRQGLSANPLLVLTVVAAQLLQAVAAYVPGLGSSLGLVPFSATDWLILTLLASAVLIGSELDKWWSRPARTSPRTKRGSARAADRPINQQASRS